MRKFFVITIDTEIDSPKWKPEFPFKLENIKHIPYLQKVFDKFNVKPTYLLTYPVASDNFCADIFREILREGKCEIGAHLHPWTTPPFLSKKEKLKLSYPHTLPFNLEKQKLKNLTSLLKEKFNINPLSYRAGRYGIDRESLEILKELGYKIDTSITPFLDWSSDGGCDFSFISSSNPFIWEGLLEVPITIGVLKKIPKIYYKLPSSFKFFLKKIKLVKIVWLRPSISNFQEMKELVDLLINEGIEVFNIMFHSNEIVEGKSPYVKTKKQKDLFFYNLEKILDYFITKKGAENKLLSDLLEVYYKKINEKK